MQGLGCSAARGVLERERGPWGGRGTGADTGRDGGRVREGVYGERTVPGCWGLPGPAGVTSGCVLSSVGFTLSGLPRESGSLPPGRQRQQTRGDLLPPGVGAADSG